MPANPHPDLQRTTDARSRPNGPSTVDATGTYRSAPETEPFARAPGSDGPTIPGYAITGEIARGGMGRVLAARELALDREVAVKVLLPGADPTRFVTESKITATLPHPNIPPVYALGTLTDGSPFLAMKYIRGDTLADRLDERPDVATDLPLFLQVFEQIAQAVGFAHSRGVIHRDLKPANVMVGEFGEVQVMDWGLAKVLAPLSPGGGEGDSSAPLADGDNGEQTQDGQVLGTPAYMAPEQARGEPADARADVFALGGILTATLTGQAVFSGNSAAHTVRRAAAGDTADALARLRACGADAELIDLATTCLRVDRDARPADGAAVAKLIAAYRLGVEERLRQAETDRAAAVVREGEQRKRRKAIQWAGGIIATVLAAGVAASVWQMLRAVEAEERATANAAQAEANARQARDERDGKDRALAAETKARSDERKSHRQAFVALRTLCDEVVERQMARNAVLGEENKRFLRAVVRQFEAFAAVTGDDAESREIRAVGLSRVGLIQHRLGQLAEAEAAYRDGLALLRQLATDRPAAPAHRKNLAEALFNSGALLRDTGRLGEAEANWREALAVFTRLVEECPDQPDYRYGLVKGQSNLGGLLTEREQLPEAESTLRAALAAHLRLEADFPSTREYRETVPGTYDRLGQMFFLTGRFREAETAARDAVAAQKRVVADSPQDPDARQALAMRHFNLAGKLTGTGKVKEREAAYRDALDLQRPLAAEFPANPNYRYLLAVTLGDLVKVLLDTGRPREAEPLLRDAAALRKRLLEEVPDRADFQEGLASVQLTFGDLLCDLRKRSDAEPAYRDAVAGFRRLTADFPKQLEYRRRLATSQNNLGLLLSDTDRPTDAAACWRDALASRERLAADNPARVDFQEELASSCNNLGSVLVGLGKVAEGKELGQRAVAVRTRLVADHPDNPDLRNGLAGSLVNRARDGNRTGDYKAARGYLAEAQPHHAAALKANPRHPAYRQFWRNHLSVLAAACAGALDPDEVLRTADTIRDLGWDPANDAVSAASVLSDCIRLVQDHPRLDADGRRRTADRYGGAAVTLLRRLVDRDDIDPRIIRLYRVFDPLRDRDDFKALTAVLDRKHPPPKPAPEK